jgi:hypothetical protein
MRSIPIDETELSDLGIVSGMVCGTRSRAEALRMISTAAQYLRREDEVRRNLAEMTRALAESRDLAYRGSMQSIPISETPLAEYGVVSGMVCGAKTREQALEMIASVVPHFQEMDRMRKQLRPYQTPSE